MSSKKSNQALKETQFVNDHLTNLGIEWMTLAKLRKSVPAEELMMPERLDFYMVILITQGEGEHMVDFVSGQLSPGSLVFVRPGQVQQWALNDHIDGHLLIITAQSLFSEKTRSATLDMDGLMIDEWPAITRLSPALIPEMTNVMMQLQHDFERFNHSNLDVMLIRHDVQGLLIRLGRWFSSQSENNPIWLGERTIYRLFIRELEIRFTQRFAVKDYAERLGYSESTLSRACQVAEGRTAKQVIDRRVALEAARQLVHSKISVAEIGYALGFNEATNFVKFFGRMHNMSPQAFRRKMEMQGHKKMSKDHE